MVLSCDSTGGDVSPVAAVLTTVTVKLAVAVFPELSDAVQVIVVTPTGRSDPDAGVHVGPTVTPTLSLAAGAS
jgi:hypothetical protein